MIYYVKLNVESRLCVIDPQHFIILVSQKQPGQWATFEFDKGQGREERGNEHTHAAHSTLPYVSHTMYAQPHTHPIHSETLNKHNQGFLYLWRGQMQHRGGDCVCDVVTMLWPDKGLGHNTFTRWHDSNYSTHTHTHTCNYVVLLCHCTVETKATEATQGLQSNDDFFCLGLFWCMASPSPSILLHVDLILNMYYFFKQSTLITPIYVTSTLCLP